VLRSAYRAFNARDVEAAIALMQPEVDWPKAWEGGRVSGRAAVRDFWNGVVEGLLAEASLTATDAGYIKATEEHRDVNTGLRGGCRSASSGWRRALRRADRAGAPYVDRAAVNYVVGCLLGRGKSSSNGTPMARTCGAVDVQLLGCLMKCFRQPDSCIC
jgi:hypothetical protein